MTKTLNFLHVILCGMVFLPLRSNAESRLTLNINPAWRFQVDAGVQPIETQFDDSKWDLISLPHSHRLFQVSLVGYSEHGRECGWYRRHLRVPQAWLQKKVFLEFQGAMQTTTLWVNGKRVGEYSVSGFDSFSFDISSCVVEGDNIIAVKVDNTRNPEIPPDGVQMDYVLFGGLYRDVRIHVQVSGLTIDDFSERARRFGPR